MKKILKKILLLALVSVLALSVFGLTACGEQTTTEVGIRERAVAEVQVRHDKLIAANTYTNAEKAELAKILSDAIAEINAIGGEDDFSTISEYVNVVEAAVAKLGKVKESYTYYSYLAATPSLWSNHTYQNENDRYILQWLNSAFYEFDYEYDINGNVVPGGFSIVNLIASGDPIDVSDRYVGKEWGIKEGATGHAWQIPIRDNLKWDDGTPIVPADFVYSMEQLLDPDLQNRRADSFYMGSTVIHNAKAYLYQNQTVTASIKELIGYAGVEDLDELLTTAHASAPAFINFDYSFGVGDDEIIMDPKGRTVADALQLFKDVVAGDEDKETEVLDGVVMNGWGASEATAISYFLDEVYIEYTFPAMDKSKIGIKADDSSITLILDTPIQKGFDFAYNLGSSWLVKKDVYEACKVAPSGANLLWTSTYGTSIATSPSFGPYKLSTYQLGKEFILTKNNHWVGYTLQEMRGKYQTTTVNYQIVADWSTAWQMFQKGELSGISIDTTIATDYKGSGQAYFTPEEFVSSIQIQSSATALKNRETAGIDKEILTNIDFRKALSLAINRSDYATQVTTSSLAGYGLFNSMHYYDVQHGKAYRETDTAKEVLCRVYGVEYGAGKPYATLDEAYDAITGYDLTQARQLVTSAYNQAKSAGLISDSDKIELVYGTEVDVAVQRRIFNFLNTAWKNLMVGTPLEGRFELKFDSTFGSAWANDFRAGAYDICAGGWSGAAWDPFWFMTAYLSNQYRYAQGWNPNEAMITITIPGAGAGGADITDTLSAMQWYNCVNGNSGAKYNFGPEALEMDKRLIILGAMEECVLGTYYSVPVAYSFLAHLRSYQIKFPTKEYNTFMMWGSLQYYSYNYTDTEWNAFKKDQPQGIIDYK